MAAAPSGSAGPIEGDRFEQPLRHQSAAARPAAISGASVWFPDGRAAGRRNLLEPVDPPTSSTRSISTLRSGRQPAPDAIRVVGLRDQRADRGSVFSTTWAEARCRACATRERRRKIRGGCRFRASSPRAGHRPCRRPREASRPGSARPRPYSISTRRSSDSSRQSRGQARAWRARASSNQAHSGKCRSCRR